jgi:hypothetical protein
MVGIRVDAACCFVPRAISVVEVTALPRPVNVFTNYTRILSCSYGQRGWLSKDWASHSDKVAETVRDGGCKDEGSGELPETLRSWILFVGGARAHLLGSSW